MHFYLCPVSRVLKDWKEKDRTHVDWVKAWLCTLTELQAYVKKYFTTGLTWSLAAPLLLRPRLHPAPATSSRSPPRTPAPRCSPR